MERPSPLPWAASHYGKYKSAIIEDVAHLKVLMDIGRRFRRYGLTVVAVGAALGFARAFGEPPIWFVLAVLASVLFGGGGPGLAAVVLSGAVLISFVGEPHLPVFLGVALSGVAFVEARRRADNKDRLAEETLNTRLTVDRFPGMVATLTAKGEPEFLNSRLLDYLGKTAEELKDWPSILHPMDRDRVVRALRESTATGGPLDVEQRVICADGSYRWFTNRGLPMYDRKGRIVRWYLLIADIDDRKRAEEALRASELNFRMIVESIPGMVGTMTAAGELEFANRRVLTFLGTTLEGLRDWARYVHPEDRDWVVARYRHAIETGEELDFECRVLRADGVYRWLHYRGLPYRDSEGHVTRRYFLQTDIEDLKRAEEAARANELKFRLTIDNIPGLAFTCTHAGELEFVNKRVMEFFGKTLDELQDWPSLVHPEDRARIVAQWTRSVETGEVLDEEARLLGADGVYRWAHSHHLPYCAADGHVVRWHCLITDIDERRCAEEALRTRERELTLIVETIPGFVWCAVPGNGDVTYVNRRVLDFVGKSTNEFAQRGWQYFLHPEDKECTIATWSRAVATGEPYEIRTRFRGGDGSYRWFYALAALGRDDAGQPTRWYGILLDIDDRMNLEETLRGMQERLSRAAKAATLGELSAAIAHEVGQPLAAVVANGHACLRWLSAQPPNLAKAMGAAERVSRDGTEAGEIVRRIRALFKQAPFEKLRLDLNEVIREVLITVRSQLTQREVALVTELTSEIPPVAGDRIQLQQVLLNLVHNALDAMEAVHDRPRILRIRSHRESANEVMVDIQDSGVGLCSPEKVFDTFFTTKKDGMGMGLAICRSIVEAHEGRLWTSSPDGPGAIFSFALPALLETTQ